MPLSGFDSPGNPGDPAAFWIRDTPGTSGEWREREKERLGYPLPLYIHYEQWGFKSYLEIPNIQCKKVKIEIEEKKDKEQIEEEKKEKEKNEEEIKEKYKH